MNRLKKALLRLASGVMANVRKYYRLYRLFLRAIHPGFARIYGALDRKIVVEGREIPARVFRPKGNDRRKALIFFHGGGWVTGDIDTYTKTCAEMAKRTRHTVVSVDYRLAPEHPFPAGLEDCYEAAREIFRQLSLAGCRAEDITLIGDSAGGNLAAAVSLMARDKGAFAPRRQILIYPATYFDHGDASPFPSVREYGTSYLLTAEKIQAYLDLYVPNPENRNNPYVAPLLAPDLSDQPETLIITAEYDPLRDEGEAYGERLKEFGNQVRVHRIRGALHGFLAFSRRSDAVEECYRIINEFLWDSK